MQTNISTQFHDNPRIAEAETILRACVHCGFCTATCPTYQALGDELDGPRGRIYLIKQVLEGAQVSAQTQQHLDRCLTCRSCETTCPSGVHYSRLLDIGRDIVEQTVPRSRWQLLLRYLLRKVIPFPRRLKPLLLPVRLVAPLLPRRLQVKVKPLNRATAFQKQTNARKIILFQGCVQSVSTPGTNTAAQQVLQRLGIESVVVHGEVCCGALSHHLNATEEALGFVRRNIDAWWPLLEQGVEAIVSTASGCGVMLKDYGELLKHDSQYAQKAEKVSALAKDLSEVLVQEDLSPVLAGRQYQPVKKVSFHSPCTLQHGLKLTGLVEKLLSAAGYKLTQVRDSHLCCGSAGTYSILQPKISQYLLDNKLVALQHDRPDIIATANIGCQMHMAAKSAVPVVHWIELLVGDALTKQTQT
ncbi:MAG: glycolate oxidase subunit GlcF [Gammaproteobacteria bacterium]|nr:glycolate oxidase subunit GlcF [Gammaproteobacteria bacterium]MDH5803475.1 glycolate oxidase subunit GlcF [Gammaproteobacteria bacterium]